MQIRDIIARETPPRAWAEGDNIPWNEPEFSRRMLREHLSQDHNLASRRVEVIDRQVRWIHEELLSGMPGRILDLTCGPGLYASRLAGLGHACVGIDFSPESIRYARETVPAGVSCTYLEGDVRRVDYGTGFGLAMMLFGQFNVFPRDDARAILAKAWAALAPGGCLLLEAQRYETVEQGGSQGPSWFSVGEGAGLFSDRAHLCLTENCWDPDCGTSTERFFIIDAETGEVTRHALSNEAYREEDFRNVLAAAGFEAVRFVPSLVGAPVSEESQAANTVIVARKPVGPDKG